MPAPFRISKACQACRQRKTRCDGHNPCGYCRRHAIDCHYRRQYRQTSRPSPKHISTEVHQASTSTVSEGSSSLSSTLQTSHATNMQIGERDNTTHFASLSRVPQNYYGASSNFAFLQQIQKGLSAEGVQAISSQGEIEECRTENNALHHKGLLLGPQSSTQTSRSLDNQVNSRFLPCELATDFLERYISTLYVLHPFQSHTYLRSLCSRLYAIPGSDYLEVEDSALIMTIIGIGATLTEHLHWSEVLIEKVKRLLTPLDEVLGIAVRKALAAGLHRVVHEPRFNSDAIDHVQEGRTTIWCLYFYESVTCFTLGRPSSIAVNDISSPYPNDRPLIPAIVRLSKISASSAERIYGRGRLSLLEMWTATQEVHQELQDFASTMEDECGFGVTGTIQNSDLGADQIFTTLYHQTVTLIFRPFLIVHLTCQKQHNTSFGQDPPPLSANTTWLLDACSYAVNAAIESINFLSKTFTLKPVTKNLRYFSFYIEGACLLLLYDILRHRSCVPSNVRSIHIGIQCLTDMIPDQAISSNIFKIRKMLNAASEAFPQPNGDSINGLPDSLSNRVSEASPTVVRDKDTANDIRPQDTVSLQNSQGVIGSDTAQGVAVDEVAFLDHTPLYEFENFSFDPANINWEFDVFASDFNNSIFEGRIVDFPHSNSTGVL